MPSFVLLNQNTTYLWPFHSKLSMLSACHGLLVARSLIKGSLMSLVKLGQKTDCLAWYRVLSTPI